MTSSQDHIQQFGLSVTNALQYNPGDEKCMIQVKKEAIKEWKARSQQMNILWNHFNSSILQIYQSENQQFLDDLNTFIKSHSKGKLGHVPTANIRLGMNVADNQLLADMIEKSVIDHHVALFVVRLSSEDCLQFSSIKAKIADGLIDQGIGSEMADDDDVMDRAQLLDLSYPYLALARKQYIKDQKPVVVIIDDVENCGNKPGLDSFLITSQQCLENLNIVIILCCYTGCLTLQQLLPTLSCDTMYLSSFSPRSPRNVFQSIMSKVVLTPDLITFKFSPKCLQLFVDNFVFVDISISRASLIIKACLFQLFHSSPLILSFRTEKELEHALNSLPKKELNQLIKAISKLPTAKGAGSLTKEVIQRRLKEIHLAHLNLLDLCTHLFLFTKDLPGSKLATTVTGIFISFLGSRNYGESDDVEETVRALRFLTVENFRRMLDICFNNGLKTGPSEFSQLLLKERETLNSFKEEDIIAKPIEPIPQSEMEPCKTRSEWKEKMKKRISEIPKVLSKFEVWRNNFLLKIKKYLNQVTSPYFMPLRELVYFDDVDYVVEHVFPSIRNQIVHDLRHPLKKGKEEEVIITHVENMIQQNEGSKVDMVELLENYKAEMEFEKKQKDGTVKDMESRISTCVTFIYDLEFVGMIQKDKQGADIYTKATWETE